MRTKLLLIVFSVLFLTSNLYAQKFGQEFLEARAAQNDTLAIILLIGANIGKARGDSTSVSFDEVSETGIHWGEKSGYFDHYKTFFDDKKASASYQEAVKWMRKGAELGVVKTWEYLGYSYEFGMGVDTNYQEAFKWFSKAAERGNSGSMNALGEMYEMGLSVDTFHSIIIFLK